MSSYFEGWYFKHQKEQNILAIVVGRATDNAFIQVITQEHAYRINYPLSSYHGGKTIRIDNNEFSLSGISLSIHQQAIDLSGHLYYSRLMPINGDIMGPFRHLPMQCRHTVVSMSHRLTGSIRLNGIEIDFTDGKGYIEGDSGCSFPKSYTWLQCNDFDKDCSIMASAAHIPLGFCWFWGCISLVCLDGIEYRLATYHGAKILHRDEKQFVLAQKDLQLKVLIAHPHAGFPLSAPIKGKMDRSIREVPAAPAYFEFQKGGRILFQAESQFASYEYVE